MREIKFRAWDGKSMEQVYELDISENGPFRVNNDIDSQYDKWPIMQFTGLKDKNGKEIYEGDVFTSEWRRDHHVIQFSGGAFRGSPGIGVGFVFDTYESSTSTVLGNIYENPELLK